jgi:putative Holliday junction resolvase
MPEISDQRDNRGVRVLALDLGKRRIGVAVSDELGLTAQGLETLQRTNIREDVSRLAELVSEYGVGEIVLGKPLHMDGREGRQVEWVKDFAERLRGKLAVPVRLWDERLTTVEAERMLKTSGISIRKRALAVDRVAAVLLLESYLGARGGGALAFE